MLTVSSRQQQSYFTLQGDWSVNCDVCGCSRNCVFSLLMSASRNTKAKENIFPFVCGTKNRFFIRNVTLWGFSRRHPLYLCRLAMREIFFSILLFTAEWYVCVSPLCRVPTRKSSLFACFQEIVSKQFTGLCSRKTFYCTIKLNYAKVIICLLRCASV